MVKIRVERDKRSYEQQRKDLVSNVEKTIDVKRGKEIQPITNSNGPTRDLVPHNWLDDQLEWRNNLHSWIEQVNRDFDNDLRRMRSTFFDLKPLDFWGFQPNSGLSIFDHMNRRMAQMHQEMMQRVRDLDRDWSPSPFFGERGLDLYKDAFEVGEDGKVHFKVNFNVSDFDPEDIEVRQEGRDLMVHARKKTETKNSKSSREFCQALFLPPSVDESKFKCTMSQDGILTCEAPVIKSDYNSLKFDADRNVSIRPKSSPSHTQAIKEREDQDVIIEDTSDGSQRLRIELPVDRIYTADDITVKVEKGILKVTGDRRHGSRQSRWRHGSSDDYFSRSFRIPKTVDPMSVTAELKNGVLLIYANL